MSKFGKSSKGEVRIKTISFQHEGNKLEKEINEFYKANSTIWRDCGISSTFLIQLTCALISKGFIKHAR